MRTSIFNQLFKIKYGNRSEGTEDVYNIEENVPDWDKNFNKLLSELEYRKELYERVMRNYSATQAVNSFSHDIMDATIETFEEIRKARFSEPLESIIAQEALMLVYGIKILIIQQSRVKEEDDAVKFYKLYCILHETCLAIDNTYKNDGRNFWHRYSFKLGLHWLVLTLKVRETKETFFVIDKEFGLYLKNHHGRGANPIYFIVPSIVNLKGIDRNYFIEELIQKEVRRIIESGIK